MNTFSYDQKKGITWNDFSIETNINLINTELMQERFIADIIKDGDTINDISYHLSNCFPEVYKNEKKYTVSLKTLENILRNANILETNKNETILKNILKTSTVGSNTRISDATNVFYESGFRTETICRNKSRKSIGTPASILDSLDKEIPTEYFPKTNQSIMFDKEITYRLGFPTDVTWKCDTIDDNNGTYAVKINYGNNVVLTDENISRGNRGIFSDYSKGNEEKNKEINTSNKINDKDKIKKILLTKELGDVAQIWLYFAFIVINEIYKLEYRSQSVMITGDNVVYIFCAILSLSCVYTGSREGVESGACTLKHYVVGEVDYVVKYKNIIQLHYDRIKSNYSNIIFGLRIMIQNFKQFEYYRILNNKIKRTIGDFNMNPLEKVTQSKELFNRIISLIETMNKQIDVIYNNSITELDEQNNLYFKIDDESGNISYLNYLKKIEEILVSYEKKLYAVGQRQILTKTNIGFYILHPGPILDEFAKIINIEVPTNIQTIIKIIPDSNVNTSSLSETIGGNPISGNTSNIGYYECLFLCFIYIDICKKIKFDNVDNPYIFAMIYDHYVSLLKHDTNIDDILPGIIKYNNTNTEDNIVMLGNKLAKYISFAKDIEKENIFLQNTSYNSVSVPDNKLTSNKKRPNELLYSMDDNNNNIKKLKPLIRGYGGKKRNTKKRNTKKRKIKKRITRKK